jgi:hypothetical protein
MDWPPIHAGKRRWKRAPAGAALLLAAAALFLIANRASYRGYFQDDELNNISWTGELPASEYAKGVLTPRFFPNNFRPAGHFYYHVMTLRNGLDFPKYLPVIHLAHILNFWMVWLLARRLGIDPLPATLGTLFFAFHMASFDIYWKPMYVFDLLCATFTLACLLLYSRRCYALAFASFWLAYKSKELAVMIPFALAAYELWIGKEKRWKPLVPFFAASLSFGLQGVLRNPNLDNDYTFRFTPQALWTCLSYYSSRVLLAPYAGLALLPLPFLIRDRRLWFGCAMLCVFFAPLLFLPGRLFAAYCYLPLAGLALTMAALASKSAPAVAALAALWIPWNLAQLRSLEAEALRIAEDNRAYVSALEQFARRSPDTRVFLYDGAPAAMHVWGIEGALDIVYGRPPELHSIADPAAAEAGKRPDAALLQWDAGARKLSIAKPSAAQFGEGWHAQEDGFRWIAPAAAATLPRPAGTREFALTVNIPEDQIRQTGPVTVAVSIDGVEIGTRQFRAAGVQSARWPAPESASDRANLDIRVSPEYRPTNGDTRKLGVAVMELGFR